MRWTGQSWRSTELGLGSHGPLNVGGRHVILVAAMAAARRWRWRGEGGGNGGGAARAAAIVAARQGRRRWQRRREGSKANNMIFDSTGEGDVYSNIHGGGEAVYSIIHVSY